MNPQPTNLVDATLRFLSEPGNITATLATASATAVPHAAVMYFAVNNDLSFYFLTATDTQKYRNLLENPQSSLSVGFGPAYVTVQAYGEAVLLEKGSEEENLAIGSLKKRLIENNRTWPIFQLAEHDDDAMAVFKFVPNAVYCLNLESGNNLPMSTDDLQRVL